MSQKLPVNNFEWIEDTSNEKSDKGYFFQVDVQHLEKLDELHNVLPFLPERMKIENVERILANVHDKAEYVIYIRNLKQALNHGLVF